MRSEVAPASDGSVLSDGEDVLFRLAARWSVDPHLLNRRADLPPTGLVGQPPE